MKHTIVSGKFMPYGLIAVCSIKSVKVPKNYKIWIKELGCSINVVE